MAHSEVLRCRYCGNYLFTATSELPFDIPSTGATLFKLDLDLSCKHCGKRGTYGVDITFKVDK